MCLYPKLIKNPKYIPNKKNGGVVPPYNDPRVLWVPIGCQKCIECKRKKAREWQVRLSEDLRENKNGRFITFTYDDKSLRKLERGIKLDGYDLDNEVASISIERFRERWRKKYGKSIRHWLVTELGGTRTERLHIHGIVWTDKPKEEIQKIWKYGHIWEGTFVSDITINYIVKYINKTDSKHENYNSKIFTSKGIGANYTSRIDAENNKFKPGATNEAYKNRQGIKRALPIYYRNKLYSEEERELLWLEKLDQETRWVDKKEIDISESEEEYYKALEEARTKNKRLGYGDDVINWKKKKYEQHRRNLKKQERINKLYENYTTKRLNSNNRTRPGSSKRTSDN
jgi:hypothetical protein